MVKYTPAATRDAVDSSTAAEFIDTDLVRRLVAVQFPQWVDHPIQPVALSGNDHRTFHLGDGMSVRLPSQKAYAGQIEKEWHWLPRLAPQLPLPIPEPLAIGEPGEVFPWPWAVYRWIDGSSADVETLHDPPAFAVALASFLSALHQIDAAVGPPPGPHNFFRGGSLVTYDGEAQSAIAELGTRIDGAAATEVWEAALDASWSGARSLVSRVTPTYARATLSAASRRRACPLMK